MKFLFVLIVAIGVATIARANSEAPGVIELAIKTPARESDLQVLVWYPTSSTKPPRLLGANAVFSGTPGRVRAEIGNHKNPLVLISHGGFRSNPNSANWLASSLAVKGFVVAVVLPPAVAEGPPSPDVVDELYRRPRDLSATISALTLDKEFGARIDFERVGAIGFFLGGYSVLALAGARLDFQIFSESCSGELQSLDCDWFNRGAVDLHKIDSKQIVRQVSDPRVQAVIVVDPELTHSFSDESLGSLTIPVHLINIGQWGSTGSILNASDLPMKIPGASYTRITEAGKFSAFGECTRKGVAILKAAGENADLCLDGKAKASRHEIHEGIASVLAESLRRALGN